MADPITGFPDTLIVDDQDIRAFQGWLFEIDAFTGLFAPAIRRGQNKIIPGRRGQRGERKQYDSYSFQVPFYVDCTDDDGEQPATPVERRAQTITNYFTGVRLLLGDDGLVDLARRLVTGPGTYLEHTAAGEFAGVTDLTEPSIEELTGNLNFNQLDGAWLDEGIYASTWVVP